MQLFLHIGLHKTGTTTFQQLIWPNWPGIEYLGKSVDLRKAIYSDSSKILFSSETLSGDPKRMYLDSSHRKWRYDFEHHLRNLSEITSSAKVILGLRKPIPMMASAYKHYVKYGGTVSLDTFFCGPNPVVVFDDLRTFHKIKYMQSLFPGRTFCFFLEELKENPSGLMSDLAGFLGTGVPDISSFELRSLNEGLGVRQLSIARAVNVIAWEQLGLRFSFSPLGSFRTAGFRVATSLTRLGMLRNDRPLNIPNEMQDAIRDEAERDLRDSVALLSATRPNLKLTT